MSDPKETPTSPTKPAMDAAETKDTTAKETASPASPASPASGTAASAASPTKPASPPPETPAAAPTAPAAPPAAPTHPNPKVAALQGMFPTVDVGVIEVVLESMGGSQDRAIESLLQMTDPEFKPDTTSAQTEETTSQLNMDEEFARALHIQEQEALRAPRPSAPQRTTANAIPAVLPYQPRVRRPRPQPQPDPYASREHDLEQRYGEPPAGHGSGGDPPGMIAFEEKLGQYAEVGKQTFNSFLSRAKAKYAELQDQHAERKTTQQQAANEWREQGAAEGPMVGAHERQKYGGLWGTSPVSPGSSASPASGGHTSPRRWSPMDAYEQPTISPSRSPGPGSGSASPDKAAAPGKIDLSKLGFLPKKKVDLMSTAADKDRDPNPQLPSKPSKSLVDQIPKTPPAELSPHQLGDSDDDDDLEYTENPFDKK